MRALDGNDSLKRLDRSIRVHEDQRRFPSSYFLYPEDVDPWQPAPRDPAKKKSELEPADFYKNSACTEKWKAAQDDSTKKALKTYDETGIFISVCRHSFVGMACDMIKSGELYEIHAYLIIVTLWRLTLFSTYSQKYPLSIVNAILTAFPDDSQALAYDIGCRFHTTAKSSPLGAVIDRTQSRFAVPAWHGWTHNQLCHLDFHPLYIDEWGKSDLETTERFFSQSNACAGVTRYASKYHRHQYLDLHFKQHDENLLAALGTFKCRGIACPNV